jgi:hypothetical protein
MNPIRQHAFPAIACVGLLVVCATAWPASWGASPAVRQDQPGTSAETSAYQAAHNEKDPQDKIKLLDNFAATHPDSFLLPDAYRDEYATYFGLGDYPHTAAYVDKFLAFGEKIDPADRLEALVKRAEAFLYDCGDVDTAFRTPQAYAVAKADATQGLEAIGQLPKSTDCLEPGPCRSEREREQWLFNSVARISESSLEGDVESCKGALFDRFIDGLKQLARQSPRVR